MSGGSAEMVAALLAQARIAVTESDWTRVLALSEAVLALDEQHHQGAVLRRTAIRLLGLSEREEPVGAPGSVEQEHHHSHALDDVVESSLQLTPFSSVAARLLEMLDDETASTDQIARLAATDAVLTARILSIASSAFYQRAGTVRTLRDALLVLGSRETKSLVITICLMGARPQTNVIEHRAFWRFSLAVGVLADLIARSQRIVTGEAFTAGVMHSVGMLALDAYCPLGLRTVAELQGPGLRRLHDRQAKVFGFTDSELGARLTERWRLPPSVVQAIASCGKRVDEFESVDILESAVVRARIFARTRGINDGLEQSEPRHLSDDWLKAPVNSTLAAMGGWDTFMARIDKFFTADAAA